MRPTLLALLLAGCGEGSDAPPEAPSTWDEPSMGDDCFRSLDCPHNLICAAGICDPPGR